MKNTGKIHIVGMRSAWTHLASAFFFLNQTLAFKKAVRASYLSIFSLYWAAAVILNVWPHSSSVRCISILLAVLYLLLSRDFNLMFLDYW